MTALVYLIPVALLFGLGSLAAFLWALKNGQYDDLDGAGEWTLMDHDLGSPPGYR
jgi:cbb3-type cytochrome oxidase maturation protein